MSVQCTLTYRTCCEGKDKEDDPNPQAQVYVQGEYIGSVGTV